VDDFDAENRLIRVKTLKRKKEHVRSVPVSRDFSGEFRFWIKQNSLKHGDAIFSFRRNRAHRLMRKACRIAEDSRHFIDRVPFSRDIIYIKEDR